MHHWTVETHSILCSLWCVLYTIRIFVCIHPKSLSVSTPTQAATPQMRSPRRKPLQEKSGAGERRSEKWIWEMSPAEPSTLGNAKLLAVVYWSCMVWVRHNWIYSGPKRNEFGAKISYTKVVARITLSSRRLQLLCNVEEVRAPFSLAWDWEKWNDLIFKGTREQLQSLLSYKKRCCRFGFRDAKTPSQGLRRSTCMDKGIINVKDNVWRDALNASKCFQSFILSSCNRSSKAQISALFPGLNPNASHISLWQRTSSYEGGTLTNRTLWIRSVADIAALLKPRNVVASKN